MVKQSYEAPSVAAGLLQLARMKSGLSQAKLAARAGVPATMVSAYERDLRQPTLPTLLRLVNAAGLDLRLHLDELDPHDAVLAEMAAGWSPAERRARARQVEAWRNAAPVKRTDRGLP